MPRIQHHSLDILELDRTEAIAIYEQLCEKSQQDINLFMRRAIVYWDGTRQVDEVNEGNNILDSANEEMNDIDDGLLDDFIIELIFKIIDTYYLDKEDYVIEQLLIDYCEKGLLDELSRRIAKRELK